MLGGRQAFQLLSNSFNMNKKAKFGQFGAAALWEEVYFFYRLPRLASTRPTRPPALTRAASCLPADANTTYPPVRGGDGGGEAPAPEGFYGAVAGVLRDAVTGDAGPHYECPPDDVRPRGGTLWSTLTLPTAYATIPDNEHERIATYTTSPVFVNPDHGGRGGGAGAAAERGKGAHYVLLVGCVWQRGRWTSTP